MLNHSVIYKTLLKVNAADKGVYNFMGGDTKELYLENLTRQPADWYYRTHPITYQLNEQGYRLDQELNEINWANATVIFGCSNVFGDGIENKHTISSQLQRLLKEPVINLGIGGASAELIRHNITLLLEYYPTPKRIVILWPDRTRTVSYEHMYPSVHGSWNIEQNTLADLWNQGHNTDNQFWFTRHSVKQQCKDLVYIDACVDADDAVIVQTESIFELRRRNDHMGARDLQHPSPGACGLIAQWIRQRIKHIRRE